MTRLAPEAAALRASCRLLELLRHRNPPAGAEGVLADPQHNRGLAALELGQLDHPDDFRAQLWIQPSGLHLVYAHVVIKVGLEDAVQDVVRRQAVLVGLVVAQLGAWSLD